MFGTRGSQIGVVFISVTAVTGVAIYMVLKKRKDKCYEISEISRRKWEALGDDIIVLHRSVAPSDGRLGLSLFDLKVSSIQL